MYLIPIVGTFHNGLKKKLVNKKLIFFLYLICSVTVSCRDRFTIENSPIEKKSYLRSEIEEPKIVKKKNDQKDTVSPQRKKNQISLTSSKQRSTKFLPNKKRSTYNPLKVNYDSELSKLFITKTEEEKNIEKLKKKIYKGNKLLRLFSKFKIQKELDKIFDGGSNILKKLKKFYNSHFRKIKINNVDFIKVLKKIFNSKINFDKFLNIIVKSNIYNKDILEGYFKDLKYTFPLRESEVVQYDPKNNIIIINFRGTLTRQDMDINKKNKLKSMILYNMKGKYHTGYVDTIINDELKKYISYACYHLIKKHNIKKNKLKYIFFGHSLGAAMAIIAAMLFYKNPITEITLNNKTIKFRMNPKNISVVGLGVPPVMDDEAADEYNSSLGKRTLLINNKNDPISSKTLRQIFFPYQYSRDLGKILVLDSPKHFKTGNLKRHYYTEYIRFLKDNYYKDQELIMKDFVL